MRRIKHMVALALLANIGAGADVWANETTLAQGDLIETLEQDLAESPLSWALKEFSKESQKAFNAMVQLTKALMAHPGVQVEHYVEDTKDGARPAEWRVFKGKGSDGLRFKFKLGHADHTSVNFQQLGRMVHYRAKLWLNGQQFSLRLDPNMAEPRAYAINEHRQLYSISDGHGPELVRSVSLTRGRQSTYTYITKRPWFIESAAKLAHMRALMPEHSDPSAYVKRVTRERYHGHRRYKATTAEE